MVSHLVLWLLVHYVSPPEWTPQEGGDLLPVLVIVVSQAPRTAPGKQLVLNKYLWNARSDPEGEDANMHNLAQSRSAAQQIHVPFDPAIPLPGIPPPGEHTAVSRDKGLQMSLLLPRSQSSVSP